MGAAETASAAASKIAEGWTWLGERLFSKPVVSGLKSIWSAEYAWAKRHPTITSVAAGAVAALAAGALAVFLAPATIAGAALVMLVGGVGGLAGGLTQYLTNAQLTGSHVSGWELLAAGLLSGGLGILTAGVANIAAEGVGPLVSSLFSSPAAQKAVTEVVADAGANGLVNGTVAVHAKIAENVSRNLEQGKPLLAGATDGVAAEAAKNVVVAAGSAVATKGLLPAAGAAKRALSPAPELPPIRLPVHPIVSAPEAPSAPAPSAPEPPREGFAQVLDEGSPLGPAAASSPMTSTSAPEPTPASAATSSASDKSTTAHALENTPFGGQNDTAKSWSTGKPGDSAKNAAGHWSKHAAEFPELKNLDDYTRAARSLRDSPPPGALEKVRANGERVVYDPATNTFGTFEPDGTPKTLFRPKRGNAYFDEQK